MSPKILQNISSKHIKGKPKEATRTTRPVNHDMVFLVLSEFDELTSLSLLNGLLQNVTTSFPSFPDI